MAKKESTKKNYQAHDAWSLRKAALNDNPMAKQFQKIYRINALRQRAAENRLTEKNKAEMVRLGI